MVAALLSRAKRNGVGNLDKEVEGSGVGPGGYVLPSTIKKVAPSYVAFTSAAPREGINRKYGQGTQGPGPGVYNTREKLLNAGTPAVANFKSKGSRWMKSDNDWKPGPGAYPGPAPTTIKSGKPKIYHTSKLPVNEIFNEIPERKIIPSIPVKHQSYGYEEDNITGNLVRQGPINPGFSGMPENMVGPGDYDPKLPSKTACINLGAGSSRPDPAAAKQGAGEIPGPGYYSVPGAFANVGTEDGFYAEGSYLNQLKKAKNMPTASFRSKSDRNTILPSRFNTNNVGPGQYKVPSTFEYNNKKLLSADLQCFSSSEERFRDPNGKNNFGPSAQNYTPLTSSFDEAKLKILKRKRMASRSDWAMTVSFDSTAPRADFVDNKVVPPPGAYIPQDTLAHRVAKKKLGKSPWDAVYKRTSRLAEPDLPEHRRNPEIMLDNKLLESSGFKPLNEWKPLNNALKEKPKFSLPFASRVKRLPPPEDSLDQGPAPGTYDTRPSWELKRSIRFFPENKPRIKVRETIAPGPAQYQVDKYGIAGSPERRRNRKNVMVSTANRGEGMLNEYQKSLPGPGIYNVSKSLVTPSHNVYLNPN